MTITMHHHPTAVFAVAAPETPDNDLTTLCYHDVASSVDLPLDPTSNVRVLLPLTEALKLLEKARIDRTLFLTVGQASRIVGPDNAITGGVFNVSKNIRVSHAVARSYLKEAYSPWSQLGGCVQLFITRHCVFIG